MIAHSAVARTDEKHRAGDPRALDHFEQVIRPAECHARLIAHPEHMTAKIALQKHWIGDWPFAGGPDFGTPGQPCRSSREGSFLGQNASILRMLQWEYVPSTLLSILRIESSLARAV